MCQRSAAVRLYDGLMPPTDPLPYYAGLAKVLRGPTLALVLTYLEFHHSAQQDAPVGQPGSNNEPMMVDCDIACAALGISRRTLHVALSCLGRCWGTEEARGRAARVQREFLNPDHSLGPAGHDPVKIYSFTGPRTYSRPQILAMRRNYPKLDSVLTRAGLITKQNHLTQDNDTGETGYSLCSLPLILKSVMPNWGDRRAERWDRWRRENGKKSRNPGRMRKSVRSADADVSDYAI